MRNDEPELCPRYTARIIRKVKVGPSPDWLRTTLEKVGIRSINNVVDITNYVMLESGQPLHAFDYHLLKSSDANPPKIVIRRAHEGEKFTTLDGKERALTNQMLLIADETQAVALAGVMGGKNTEINANTTDVLIESAYFKPQNIRATSKKLELRTDSSYRFERGGDVGICDWASRRAAQLICDLAGGQVLGHAIDNFPHQTPAEADHAALREDKRFARHRHLAFRTSFVSDQTRSDRDRANSRHLHFQDPDVARGLETRSGFDRGSRTALRH